jgi:predicted nucleic acid-binding Zn ribbon protein
MKATRILNGYRVIYKPEHPKSMKNKNWDGYVYEHIIVAEEILKRPLSYIEVVHHLNGNKKDNRKCNILVLTKNMHGKLHMWLRKGAPYEGTLRENVLNSRKSKAEEPRICPVCDKTIHSKNNVMYCSNNCNGLDKRKIERPSKEKLQLEIESNNWETLAKKYKVSSNAIRKWARKYNLL